VTLEEAKLHLRLPFGVPGEQRTVEDELIPG